MTSERAIDVMYRNRMITTWRDIALLVLALVRRNTTLLVGREVDAFLIASLQHGDMLRLLVALKR